MTESQYTSNVVTFLKNKGVVVFKHCDRFTSGIPDVSATIGGFTTWFEFKDVKRNESVFDRCAIDKVQRFNMFALSGTGRAYYVILKSKVTYIVHPRLLFKPYDDDSGIAEALKSSAEHYVLGNKADEQLLKTYGIVSLNTTEYDVFLNIARAQA